MDKIGQRAAAINQKGTAEIDVPAHKITQAFKKAKAEHRLVIQLWKELCSELEVSGVSNLVIACTDLSLFKSEIAAPFQVVDSGEALARATVAHYLKITHK